jgi:peroxin-19
MQEMMRQMESLTDNGDFQNMLEGMMNQLMSKDLLYEPMKDLANKVRT